MPGVELDAGCLAPPHPTGVNVQPQESLASLQPPVSVPPEPSELLIPSLAAQKYLRNFFTIMLKSPTSPLNIDKVGLTLSKHTICEFSPFFKKGVFDYSSHGTG